MGEVESTMRRATGGAMRKMEVGSERTADVVLWVTKAGYPTAEAETY